MGRKKLELPNILKFLCIPNAREYSPWALLNFLCFWCEHYSINYCGFYSRAGSNRERVVFAGVRYLLFINSQTNQIVYWIVSGQFNGYFLDNKLSKAGGISHTVRMKKFQRKFFIRTVLNFPLSIRQWKGFSGFPQNLETVHGNFPIRKVSLKVCREHKHIPIDDGQFNLKKNLHCLII